MKTLGNTHYSPAPPHYPLAKNLPEGINFDKIEQTDLFATLDNKQVICSTAGKPINIVRPAYRGLSVKDLFAQ
jgi:hypothetical protein